MWAYIGWVLTTWGIWLLKKAAWWVLIAGLKWLSNWLISKSYKMLKKQAEKREEVRSCIAHAKMMAVDGSKTEQEAKLEYLKRHRYMFSPAQIAKLESKIRKA